MSRGFCGKLDGIMKMLRFICLASLLALILALGVVAANSPRPGTTVPQVEDATISTTEEDPPSCSATITITWTTAVPPEE